MSLFRISVTPIPEISKVTDFSSCGLLCTQHYISHRHSCLWTYFPSGASLREDHYCLWVLAVLKSEILQCLQLVCQLGATAAPFAMLKLSAN